MASNVAAATPILDRQAPLPPPESTGFGRRAAAAAGLALAALGAVAWWQRAGILNALEPMLAADWTPSRVILLVLALPLIGFAVTTLHELGHVIAGLLMGFRCSAVFVGPLQFSRPFRWSLNPDPRAWIHGGASLFPTRSEGLRGRGLVMVFAGPGANLLTGGALLLWPGPPGPGAGFFIALSLAAGVIELLVPLQGPTFVHDGRRIVMLLRHPERGERWLALTRLSADLRAGVPPESLPGDFLARAVAVRDPSADTVAAHGIAYAAAFHKRDDAEAGRALETCLAHVAVVGPPMRDALMSDAVVFQARRRGRDDLAGQWLADLPATAAPWLRSRAEAAVLEARGDVGGALRKLEECERAVLGAPDRVQRDLVLRLLRRWKSELEGRTL